MPFVTRHLQDEYDVLAPDGSEVRLLATTGRGSMAHFRLAPGEIARAVSHRTVEEVWYVASGRGRMWRKLGDEEEVVELRPGVSLAIPTGAAFQFRSDGEAALEIVGVTMPPWPGAEEAVPAAGKWPPTA